MSMPRATMSVATSRSIFSVLEVEHHLLALGLFQVGCMAAARNFIRFRANANSLTFCFSRSGR